MGQQPHFQVVETVELALPDTASELRAMLEVHRAEPPRGQLPQVGHIWVSRPVIRQGEGAVHQQVNESNLASWFDARQLQPIRETFVRLFTLRLDGRTRFDLVEEKPTGPLESHPQNHLWALFVNDQGREQVRTFTEEAFGRHFVIDPTGMTTFRARLSDRKPASKAEEQSLDATSRTFHKKAPLASELGDGVRTSVGLVAAVMSLPHRVLLIDEPEAFLHPTLARRVGTILSQTARDRDASLIVATHSAEFLMGCIQSTPELRLVRLTFSNNQATARSIEPSEILKLMNDPLLRSANALRALFHRAVIVAEADADRAFYEEINYRLQQKGRGIADNLFMNAQNWQTVPRIVAPLRKLGIPAAAIVDFEVLMDEAFNHIWPLLHLQQQELAPLQNRRAELKGMMEARGRDNCKARGQSAFTGTEHEKIEQFITEMAKYGVFFVPVGELECWLPTLGIPRRNNKAKWLTEMFTRLGSDPAAPSYVGPGANDVWKFLETVEAWIKDPARRGLPE